MQIAGVQTLDLPLISCVKPGNLLQLSESEFPQWENREN